MNGLTTINIELTSRCQKNCSMCGRRKIERDYPDIAMNYGDMDFNLVKHIAQQVPTGTIVQFHNNGEPTLYPELWSALKLFGHCIRQFNTNGILLAEKAIDIIDNLDVLTISVIEDDIAQKEIVSKFIDIKGGRNPRLVYRLLGDVDPTYWEGLPGMIVTRTLHEPMGSFGYKKPVPIPEIGICLDLLSHLSIDRLGNVSPCVRFDPNSENIIGNVRLESLDTIWNGTMRTSLLQMHIDGHRNLVSFCNKCHFWGCIVA